MDRQSFGLGTFFKSGVEGRQLIERVGRGLAWRWAQRLEVVKGEDKEMQMVHSDKKGI